MSAADAGPGTLRVALGEYDTGWHEPDASLARACDVVTQAATAGCGLVALPEMFLSGFTMDPAAHAEPLDAPRLRALGALAHEVGIAVIASVARRDGEGAATRHVNTAVLARADGTVEALYDKRKLFAYGGEHAHYAAGDRAPHIVTLVGVRVATFICYDLRFPELFREVADAADLMLVVANWPAARRAHWDVLLRARAIENQCWVIGVNRTGAGGTLQYDGGSAAWDPWGERADVERDGLRVCDVSAARVAEIRARYPFLRDRDA